MRTTAGLLERTPTPTHDGRFWGSGIRLFLLLSWLQVKQGHRASPPPPTPSTSAERPTGSCRRSVIDRSSPSIGAFSLMQEPRERSAGRGPGQGVGGRRSSRNERSSGSWSFHGFFLFLSWHVKQSLYVATRFSGSCASRGALVETADSSCPAIIPSVPRRT